MVKVLPIHSGVVLVCKGRGGKKKTLGPEQFFQVQPSKTELRARYSTMPGLESSFWGGIRLQRRPGEEKNFQVPKVCFWFGCPKQGRQARQAKTSQHKPRVASEVRQPSVSLAGVWLKLSTSALVTEHKGSNHPDRTMFVIGMEVPRYIIFLLGNSCW